MVSVLALSAVDRGFEPRSDQNKDYKIDVPFLARVHKTSLTLPLFNEVPSIPSQESEWPCICVLGVSSLPLFS
jgi:hypothetical protein